MVEKQSETLAGKRWSIPIWVAILLGVVLGLILGFMNGAVLATYAPFWFTIATVAVALCLAFGLGNWPKGAGGDCARASRLSSPNLMQAHYFVAFGASASTLP